MKPDRTTKVLLNAKRAADDMADEEAGVADWKYQEYRDRMLMRALSEGEKA